jgi:hypothetical protein
MADTADAKKPTASETLLELARKRFKIASEAVDTTRKLQLEDKKFAAGEQWPEAVKKAREADGRPCLTIDRLKPQIKQVTNQQRQMRPAVQVRGVDNGADPKAAEVLQGLVRHIEASSDADDAYDQAGKDQTEIGIGWWRYRTEYLEDGSGNQRILVDRIRNPFRVYDDPAAQRRDRSDRKFLFYTTDLTPEDLKARYPNAKMTSLEHFQGEGDDVAQWIQGEHLRMAEYWHVETERVKQTLPNGKTITIEKNTVHCDHITALETLESYVWAGKYIPFPCALGEEVDIEGKVDVRGMVRGAKDPQRMFNYWKSATTEAIALAPKAPFIVAEGQISDNYMAMWKSANSKNLPYLVYKPTTVAGMQVPPPARNITEAPVQAMVMQTQAAENDIRAATGFFDTNQRETREMSGVAIRARQQQGEHGNSDYLDGLSRAVRFGGRILIDLIPKIYDAPRVVRILGLDNQPKSVMVHAGNPPQADAMGAPMLPEGVKEIYDLSVGEFDVTVEAGPSYASARQQFVEQMAEVFKAHPALFEVIGDLFFESMDIPNARQIAERLKKMLPPQLQDQQGDPAQAQAQLAALQQQMEQITAAFQEAQQKLQTKQLENESKERIAQAQMEVDLQIASINADVAKHKADVDAGLGHLKAQTDIGKTVLQIGAKQDEQRANHAAQAQAQAHDHKVSLDSQEREHGHAAHMQATKPEGKAA